MTDDLSARLGKLDTCAVSDALDRVGLAGVALQLIALSSVRRIAGRAITVELGPDDGRMTGRHLGTAAVEAAGPGDLIVVANDGRIDVGGWGGILSLGASLRGVEGVVIDGACRDVDEARDLDLPVYARAGVARTARGRIVERAWNVPITICGIALVPGDYVLADASGVVFVPEAIALDVIADAELIVAKEAAMAKALRRGDPISAVMGANYETMLQGAPD